MAQAQDEVGQAFCGLFTAKELKAAFGGKAEASPGYGSCDWLGIGGKGDLISLNVGWSDIARADRELLYGPMTETAVGDASGWYATRKEPEVNEAVLLVELDNGTLALDAMLDPGVDGRKPLQKLAKLAVGRADSLPPSEFVEPVETSPTGNDPADAIAAAFCAVLSADEVAAALGGTVADGTPTVASAGGCEWVGMAGSDLIYLSAIWDPQTLADLRAGDGEEIAIDGHAGWYSPLAGSGILDLQLDQGLLGLTADPAEGVDAKSALTTLAATVASRSGMLVAPPAPKPTAAPATDLESLFPTSVGGQAITVDSQTGAEAIALFPFGAAITDAVTAAGGDPARIALALGYSADFKTTIAAIGLAGVDAATVLPALLGAYSGSQEAQQLAGKDVTVVTVKGSPPAFIHTAGDIIWLIQAKKPAAEEVLANLP